MSERDQRALVESELLRQRIRLYLYGELSLSERQEIERYLDDDPAFSALFAEEREFLLSLGGNEIESALDGLLEDCRDSLSLAIAAEGRPPGSLSLLGRVRRGFGNAVSGLATRPLVWQPMAAALLLGLGFLAGQGSGPRGHFALDAFSVNTPSQPVAFDSGRTLTGVETVRLDPVGGQVQIVVEERRVVTGASSDPLIRKILLDTVQESHAGARLSSLEALQDYASDAEVRRALLRSMLEDENPGVRLKALDAVRGQVDHPDVRNALVQTLRRDPVEGMRVHAIQLLSERPSRDLAGALQELVEREPNPFVLHQSERILDSLGASMERF